MMLLMWFRFGHLQRVHFYVSGTRVWHWRRLCTELAGDVNI